MWEREKIINSLLFFAQQVKYPTRVKLLKLLYYLDERSVMERGLPVTDLDYYVWDHGPVAREVWDEMEAGLANDLGEALEQSRLEYDGKIQYEYKAKKKPDLEDFSPREQRILAELVEVWKDISPSVMSEATHENGRPWRKAKKEKGMYSQLDIAKAVGANSPVLEEKVREDIADRREMIRNLSRRKQ